MKNINNTPIVSIICIAYNQEAFIKDALEGFVMQKTSFPFEIIVHDDASTDNTANIIRDYEAKYPDLFVTIYQTENQYFKRELNIWGDITFPLARGKYIALCEGDDYWTDANKLQKQVDFLEENEDYALCFHNAKVIYGNKINKTHLFNIAERKLDKTDFDINDIIIRGWFIATASIVFRRDFLETPEWFNYIFCGDVSLHLILAQKGNFHYIDEVMSVYRKHELSIILQMNLSNYDLYQKTIEVLLYFNLYTNFKYNENVQIRIAKIKSISYRCLLFQRPFLIRMLSIDFYLFVLKWVTRKKWD